MGRVQTTTNKRGGQSSHKPRREATLLCSSSSRPPGHVVGNLYNFHTQKKNRGAPMRFTHSFPKLLKRPGEFQSPGKKYKPTREPHIFPRVNLHLRRAGRFDLATTWYLAAGQNPVPLVNTKVGGKWMFIHPKMEP